MDLTQENFSTDLHRKDWQRIYRIGAVATFVVLIGIILDLIIGMVTGGDLTALPHSATARFDQFIAQPWMGLYNMDFLNLVNQLIMIPVWIALYAAHRKTFPGTSFLAFIIFLTGTIVFVAVNTALPMLDLSHKFATATGEPEKNALLAAGEAMLARGAHGSPGVLISFLLPNLAGIIISCLMLKSKVFSKTTGWLGLIGSILISVYVILVAFVPAVQSQATMFAGPAGLLLMAWMILFALRLYRLKD